MENMQKKIEKLTLINDMLTPDLIREKNVKLGLRNPDGTGVVVGITTKGNVVGYEKVFDDDEKKKFSIRPIPGRLFYCGYDVIKIVEEVAAEQKFCFDEIVYLLMTGELPNQHDLKKFVRDLSKRRALSKSERSIIMDEVQNDNQMYALHSVISHMSRCDPTADSTDTNDVLRQCLNLIAKFPTIVAYNYNVSRFGKGNDLKIVRPDPELSTAENFLYMLKGEKPDRYEALLFDIALILHADHGGGNNSTFTVRTVSSSGANTYMSIAAGIASLSGHLHGGANETVKMMMKDLMKNVKDWQNEKKVKAYLESLMARKGFDRSGKIFGFGHAVYTISDPRAVILKKHAEKLAKMKGAYDEFLLYDMVERIATGLLSGRKGKSISANVDFYSGFVYQLMGIPKELYTPIFAMSRVVGWSAHRLEQIVQGKIIRPAYIHATVEEKKYMPINRRK
ncbi:MAG: citrate synthase [Spirochaetes bacterium]|jgi:citrate synthase|nr:citrate synthase [Spirochaetota bacterium]